MRELWRLLEEYRVFIVQHTVNHLALQEGGVGEADTVPWAELMRLLTEALRASLPEGARRVAEEQAAAEATIKIHVAGLAAADLAATDLAASARSHGLSLERLLRWLKCARRACTELALLGSLPAQSKPAASRLLEQGFDAVELAVVGAWERGTLPVGTALSDRRILQAVNDPVLLVDADQRLHWLNDAALALWKTTTLVVMPDQRPERLADLLPELARPWERICDAGASRASRCRFEQALTTLGGRRWFVLTAWPVAEVRPAQPCVALFLRDITRERTERVLYGRSLLSREAS